MRKLIIFCAIIICASCTKSDVQRITAVVIEQGGGSAASYRVKIENAEQVSCSFLCVNTAAIPDSILACHNSIFITNLPDYLKQSGTRIQFSRFKDKGPNAIWSSTYAAHDVEVYDPVKLR